ncbi:MAG: SEC59/DGK1/VTE5 family protein [Candidatus Marinimicrobia bacterium]|jgi:dolichol kinase|nr:SEC59/DGK1/VTE5 family protein [Candidatus Neomarinimicrobiota bacterium]MDP6611767.1 SEC59/DGK1/VTE5 family protein [Candidatus Neomarinimicrobiota bacterium]|tara:strand:- start:102642 stop:103226 length:585 start_codon:yes stop_codon:yes gene_type:complete
MISVNEILRKLIHLFNLIIPLAYIYFFPEKWQFVRILSVFTVIFIIVDVLRHRVGWIRSLFTNVFKSMMRSHELDGQFTGATWVMIGAVVAIILFSKPVAVIALIYMNLGDTAAGLIGQRFGKHQVWDKTWEGFFGGLIICVIIAFNYPALPLTVSLGGAITAMVMELVPIPLDDNFKIPLGSGAIMMMLSTPI